MKLNELPLIAAGHLLAFAGAAAIITLMDAGDPGYAFIIAASVGALMSAGLYHRRQPQQAPFKVKAQAGLVLLVMAVIAGLASQWLLQWMKYPDVLIPISAVGSFAFPWAVFGAMCKAFNPDK